MKTEGTVKKMKSLKARMATTAGVLAVAGAALVAGPAAPAHASGCGMSGGKLWCGNAANAALWLHPQNAGEGPWESEYTVVNHMYSTYSWFKCYAFGGKEVVNGSTGDNYTWYYTQGDQNSYWGWMPSMQLNTSYDMDTHPWNYGIPACPSGTPGLWPLK